MALFWEYPLPTKITFKKSKVFDIRWKELKLSPGRPGHHIIMSEHPGLLGKCFSKTQDLYQVSPVRALNIRNLKIQTQKLTSGMPKVHKSHDQPLCIYLMRYDADIQSQPRSLAKWNIDRCFCLNQMSYHHPDTDGRTDDSQQRDGWTVGQTGSIQYTSQQLQCG